jgi:hypothetical protein
LYNGCPFVPNTKYNKRASDIYYTSLQRPGCVFFGRIWGSDMGDALINKVWGQAPLMQTHDSSIHHFVKPEGSAFPFESQTFVRPSRGIGTLPVWDN